MTCAPCKSSADRLAQPFQGLQTQLLQVADGRQWRDDNQDVLGFGLGGCQTRRGNGPPLMRAQTLPQTLIHRKQHQHRHRASTIGRMASLKGITSARSSAARPSQRCSRSLSVVQASTAPKEQQPSLATALAGAAAAVLLGAAVAPGSFLGWGQGLQRSWEA